jgi:hypothetical protein
MEGDNKYAFFFHLTKAMNFKMGLMTKNNSKRVMKTVCVTVGKSITVLSPCFTGGKILDFFETFIKRLIIVFIDYKIRLFLYFYNVRNL